jgi:hypothetical protein
MYQPAASRSRSISWRARCSGEVIQYLIQVLVGRHPWQLAIRLAPQARPSSTIVVQAFSWPWAAKKAPTNTTTAIDMVKPPAIAVALSALALRVMSAAGM